MSKDTVTTKRNTNSKVKAAVLSVVALSLVGGAATQFTLGQASASSDSNAGSSSWSKSHNSSSETDAALIVDAVEAYQATPPPTTGPVTPLPVTPGTPTKPPTTTPAPVTPAPGSNDMSRVTKLDIFNDNAIGMVANGDSGNRFFAHKTDGVWQIVYMGQMAPSQDVITKNAIPSQWLSPAFNF